MQIFLPVKQIFSLKRTHLQCTRNSYIFTFQFNGHNYYPVCYANVDQQKINFSPSHAISLLGFYYYLVFINFTKTCCRCVSDIGQEKQEVELKKSISDFNKSSLNKTNTQEKNPLPPTDGQCSPDLVTFHTPHTFPLNLFSFFVCLLFISFFIFVCAFFLF